jgi:DeoR family fructose operon transcriptional repressor
MFEEERKISIINKINADNRVTISELAALFSVSESTIRRDLSSLEKSGLIKRTHGGAILLDLMNKEYNFTERQNINSVQKQSIAKFAASLIEDNETIALGSSTHTFLMAKELTARNLTVVTNSVDVLNVLIENKDYNIIVLGGNYIHKARTIEGIATTGQISQMHFDKVFLGANGVDIDFGLSTASEIEANSKLALCKNSKKAYFLCEHSKFNKISYYKIIDLRQVHAIICDNEIDNSTFTEYSKYVNILISKL